VTDTLPKGLRVFVYGTLKTGYGNHESLCKGALSVVPATVRGNLYAPLGSFPYAHIPAVNIWALGSGDYECDVRLADLWRSEPILAKPELDEGTWGTIHGELVVLPDPNALIRLDQLESYRPGNANSLYERVLVPVTLEDGERVTAWMYQTDYPAGKLIESGTWPSSKGSHGDNELDDLYWALDLLDEAVQLVTGPQRGAVDDAATMVLDKINQLEGG
jgi:gamma-glutamylcyclotransferase (GGCT)/AIG2-like uncharacterized protein YtfP